MPVALLNREQLLPAIGEAMKEVAAGGTWLETNLHEIESTLDATDLYKVFLYASRG